MFLVWMLYVRDVKALLRVWPMETEVVMEVVTSVMVIAMTVIKYKTGCGGVYIESQHLGGEGR